MSKYCAVGWKGYVHGGVVLNIRHDIKNIFAKSTIKYESEGRRDYRSVQRNAWFWFLLYMCFPLVLAYFSSKTKKMAYNKNIVQFLSLP